MTLIRKAAAGKVAGSLTYVLSDDTLDRMGDVIDPAGWDLKWFKKNPIALFNHQSSFPIGTWNNVRVENGKLIGELEPAQRGTSQRVDEIISLIEQDILRATSVGFMPIDSEPLDKNNPYGGQRYKRQQLLEASIVGVPANPAALQLAKSLHISDETMSLAFGELAGSRRRDITTGEHAETKTAGRSNSRGTLAPLPKAHKMTTLSERIVEAQTILTAKRDRLTELTAAENIDVDAIEELNDQIAIDERGLTALRAAEVKIGIGVTKDVTGVASPAIARRPLGFPQKEVKGFDLVVRAFVVRGVAFASNKNLDQVLDERYPGHEATAIVAKADQTIGTTGVSGWAAEVTQTAYGDFMQALIGESIYPELRNRGIRLSFDGNSTVSIPSRNAGGAGGGFVAEGAPIRVGRVTTAATTMTPKKMGVIVPFSREVAKRSTPAIEGLVRQAIVEDTSEILDPLILDAVAGDNARPAGLLNGVSAVAVGYGGGDYQAVTEDFKALLAPFIAANAANNITVIMNPAQGLSLDLMPGPIGMPNWFDAIRRRITFIESTHATAGRLIAIRNSDLATAVGDTPEFDVSEQATIHMEDVAPLEIVSGTGPTTADPVRSLWQTASIAVRMLMDVSWKMRRAGMVQWINGTSW